MNDNSKRKRQWKQLKEQYKLENLKSLDDLTLEEKQIVLSTIGTIDDETLWEEYEPEWWVEMANFERELYNLLC